LRLAFASLFTALSCVSCGPDLACGPGTHEANHLCVPDVDRGAGGGGASSSSSSSSSSAAVVSSSTGSGSGGGDLLDSMPPCMRAPPPHDGTIDFAAGCVRGACPDMTYDEMNAVLGSTGVCTAPLPGDTTLFCEWNGLEALFDDADADGVPDAGSTAGVLFLHDPFTGQTSDGLGLGATMRCFLELGTPSSVTSQYQGGKLIVTELQFGEFRVLVDDGFPEFADGHDGIVDRIMIGGPLP
jgi:hypothetical protein